MIIFFSSSEFWKSSLFKVKQDKFSLFNMKSFFSSSDICFDTIYTKFKFDPCINFDLEFLELLKCAIMPFVRIWKNTAHSTTIISKKMCSYPISRFSRGSIRLSE